MARLCTFIFLSLSVLASARADVKALTMTTVRMKKDHSKGATLQDTYRHRYLYNMDDYDQAKGPVLFYAGGEGDITVIAEKQKLFRTLAENLTAAIVFAEHRYYGESFPAGSKYSSPTLGDLQFLTVENVLADYVDVINHFRMYVGRNTDAKVIVYGSKYAGLLAAWLKVQNDKLITGAIASSAPVLDFDSNTDAQGRPDLGDYDKRITKIYTDAGCNLDALKRAFINLPGVMGADLNTFFRLSPPIDARVPGQKEEAIKKIRYLMRRALYAMAENNYPYAAKTGWNGLEMPANPVHEACKSLKWADPDPEGIEDVKSMAAAIGVYYGRTGGIVVKTDDPAYIAGTVQPTVVEAYEHCTGTALYRCPMGGENDFFPRVSYCAGANEFPDKDDAQCYEWLAGIGFHKQIDTTWIKDNVGFDYASKHNIVFVTGSLDPNAGGVYTPKNPYVDSKNSIYTYQAEHGTTGQDLLEPNTVKNARYQIVKIVKCWSGLLAATDCTAERLQTDLPSYDASAKPSSCAAEAYPWGQAEPTTTTSTTTTTPMTTTTSTTTTTASTATTTCPTTKAPCYECKTVFFFIKICIRSATQDCAIVNLE